MANDQINFSYDPAKQGYNTTLFKSVTGTPAVSGGNLRFNVAEALGYADIYKANVTLSINVPAVPTAADVRAFGLKQLNNGSQALFTITDTTFACTCVDGLSGNTTSVTVPWTVGWEGVFTKYQIIWTGFSCQFLINGKQVAFINDVSIPKVPLSLSVKNTNGDNMDLKYIEVRDTQGYVLVN